jgi:4-carboxymuconolactone decarboxylase
MARIPYFDRSQAVGRAARAYEKLPALNIFAMMGHAGELIDGFTRLGTQILNFTSLDPVMREIAIVRVGVLSGASYELFQHERISRRLGMSDALIAAIHEGPGAAALDQAQAEVMAFTDDVVKNVRASDATFEPLKTRLGYKALQELTITIGYYMLVSRFLETFDVDIEDV